MKKYTIFIILYCCLLSIGCNKQKEKENKNQFCDSSLNNLFFKNFTREIKFIQKENEDIDEILFFIGIFYRQNDSNMLNISYDVSPPIIFKEDYFVGFNNLKDHYIIIMNRNMPTNIINGWMKSYNLITDINELKKIEIETQGSFDGFQYIYYINNNDSLIFQKRSDI